MSASGIKAAAGGRSDLFRIDPRKLVIEEGWNCRDFTNPDNLEHIASLKISIAAKGVQEPLTARMDGDQIVITNGECRLRAVRELIADGVDVQLIPVQMEPRYASEVDHVESQIVRNSGKPLSPLEQSTVFIRLIALGRSEADLASVAGYTVERVRQIASLNTATEKTKKLVRTGRVSATMVQRSLERAKDPKAAEALIVKAVAKAKSDGKAKPGPRHLAAPKAPKAGKAKKRDFHELLAQVVSYANTVANEDGSVTCIVPAQLWKKIEDVK